MNCATFPSYHDEKEEESTYQCIKELHIYQLNKLLPWSTDYILTDVVTREPYFCYENKFCQICTGWIIESWCKYRPYKANFIIQTALILPLEREHTDCPLSCAEQSFCTLTKLNMGNYSISSHQERNFTVKPLYIHQWQFMKNTDIWSKYCICEPTNYHYSVVVAERWPN